MKKMKLPVFVLACILFCCMNVDLSYADDAEVLPKGVFNANVSTSLFFPVEKRYDSNGHIEDAATPYNSSLDSSVFTDLGDLETAFGMSPGEANIGDSVVSFKYEFTDLNILFAYGITDKLTVGINIPYSWQKNNVKAHLDTANATVGKNPLYGDAGDPFGVTFIPISVAESIGYTKSEVELSTEDVQNMLVESFGYKKLETWSDSGIQDIDAGFKYQYVSTDDWKLAATCGVRFPTGKVDDPDNLVDRGFGTGAYALLFRAHNDYIGIKNLTLNTTLRYDLYLPDRETLRVTDPNHPIAPEENKDNVKRDLGDVVEMEASGSYAFAKGFSLSLLYKYGLSFKDKISGGRNDLDYKALEQDTDYTEQIYIIGLSYSTIPLFTEKKFPFPMNASVSYRDRFAGTNNVLKSQYLGLGLGVYF